MPTARQYTQMAAACEAWAKNISDLAQQCAFKRAAQNWRERAVQEQESRPFRHWEPRVDYREMQIKIGRELQAQFDLPNDMPHQILALLMQLNNDEDA
jgi:hypothetical protein